MLSFDQITQLVELVAKRRLQRFQLEQEGFRLEIEGQATVVGAPSDSGVVPVVPSAAPVQVSATAAETGEGGPALEEGLHVLTSPIVGTFYRAPAPDADPFAEVGARVAKGQVLCIVEAMKLMNEIESDIDGVIVQVHPKNAQPVEYGEPLFVIRPA